MTVKEIMLKDVGTCAPGNDLAVAAKIMMDRDCGFLPVVDSRGAAIGVVTDRDVCRVAGASHRAISHSVVSQAMSHPVFACFPDDNLKTAIVTMAKHRVRRLPVLDKTGHLQGVLSMDDVVTASRSRGAPTSDDIIDALKAIYAPRAVEVVTS